MSLRSVVRSGVPADGWICDGCLRKARNQLLPLSAKRSPVWIANRHFSKGTHYHAAARRAPKLPNGPARTRFAPSPTGHLHIGGLRTALFSFLLARRTEGQFLLRIEDTDQKRLVPGAEERLIDDLQWAGLSWDEGPLVGGPHGPYKQSERNSIYQQHAQELLRNGSAYRCFCAPQKASETPVAYVTSGCYQNCSSLRPEQSLDRAEDKHELFTLRLKLPADASKRIYTDLIYGKIQRLKRNVSAPVSDDGEGGVDAADTILVKSDGIPTYHFANVVDDHLMEITHVIRGVEWMASTPLHYDLYHAFGWTPPEFAHVGLLVDENKAKLSKRNADLALDVRSMREDVGVLPEALVNYLALLGWSNPLSDDVYDMPGLIENFDLKFTKGNAMVRFEKLKYLQKHHVSRRCDRVRVSIDQTLLAPLLEQILPVVRERWPAIDGHPRFSSGYDLSQYVRDILLSDSKSYSSPREYAERNRYFFERTTKETGESGPSYLQTTDDPPDDHTVVDLVRDVLQSDLRRPFSVPDSLSGLAEMTRKDAEAMQWFEKVSESIHAAVQAEIIKQLLLDLDPRAPALVEDAIPLTPQHVSDHVLKAWMEWQLQANGKTVDLEERVEAAVKERKELNKAVMRYMRDKLSHGLPGPSAGVVMALLGYEESCVRLSVRPSAGGGW